MATYYVLLEGGKTKTICITVDDSGNVYGYTIVGNTAWDAIGFEKAFNEVRKCVEGSIKSSGISSEYVKYVVLGLPGLDTEYPVKMFYNIIRETGFFSHSNVLLVHDAVVAYYAITLGRPGIAVISGTGSIAYGRNSRGIYARAGGWGWFGDDEGSGYWIAIKALEYFYKVADGREKKGTKLFEKILKFFNISNPLNVIDIVYPKIMEGDLAYIARLAIIVDETANEGDEIARKILIDGGIGLGEMARAVYEKIRIDGEKLLIGGVGSTYNSKILRETFYRYISEKIPEAIPVEPLIGFLPIKGLAAIVAEKEHLDEKFIDNVLRGVDRIEKSRL